MDSDPSPLIQFQNINKQFILQKKTLSALQNINLSISKGKTLGLVGESGCGKSTLGKIALQLENPTSGSVYFNGTPVSSLRKYPSELRRQMQMIFQDPYTALNPRITIQNSIGEGLDIHRLAKGSERQEKILELLNDVGLDSEMLHRYPHELSGGQRQRVGIARALAVDPTVVVCDEPLSALDAYTQQQIMQLLMNLKQTKRLTYLFISHDLQAIRQLSDHVAVMYLGRIVEYAPTNRLFTMASHPYTQALLSAAPIADPIKERQRLRLVLKGEPPSPLCPPSGCPFHPRCPKATYECSKSLPPLKEVALEHLSACHYDSKS